MVNNVFNAFIIIVIFSMHEVLSWDSPPVVPTDGIPRTCHGWLLYHNFIKNSSTNKIKAVMREKTYDKDVSYWAAGYAYLLSNVLSLPLRVMDEKYGFGPSEFCNLHVIPYGTFMYVPLKDAEFSCEGWIDLYIFNEKRDWKNVVTSPYDTLTNWSWATTRDDKMDTNISIWAVGYFKYITSGGLEEASTRPEDFCLAMGQSVPLMSLPSKWPFMSLDESKMSCQEREEVLKKPEFTEHAMYAKNSAKKLPFINIADTKMSCQKWIALHGYKDNPVENYLKAVPKSFYGSLNRSTKDYLIYLQLSFNSKGMMMSPREFCEANKKPDTLDIYYNGETISN